MATITIDSASFDIKAPKKSYVYMNSATAEFSCSATFPSDTDNAPGFSTNQQTWTDYTYTNKTYKWTFSSTPAAVNQISYLQSSPENGYSLTGLSKSTYYSLNATLEVSCTENPQTYQRTDYYVENSTSGPAPEVPDPATATQEEFDAYQQRYAAWCQLATPRLGTPSPIATSENPTTVSDSTDLSPVYIATRPGVFSAFATIQANDLIQDYLTTTNITDWKDHCNAFAHWWNQNNTDTAGSACSIPADRIIYASWYNNCCDACADANTRPAHVVGGPNGTIITPSLFSALGAAISKDDNA